MHEAVSNLHDRIVPPAYSKWRLSIHTHTHTLIFCPTLSSFNEPYPQIYPQKCLLYGPLGVFIAFEVGWWRWRPRWFMAGLLLSGLGGPYS